MIIDIHVHIHPAAVIQDRIRFFDGEPEFRWLYEPEKSRMASPEDVLRMMDENGVDQSALMAFPWRRADHFRRHNDEVLEAAARRPDRFLAFACMDVRHPEAVREAQRCLDAGAAGIGELGFYLDGLPDAALDALSPIMDLCRERRRPVLLHVNEPVGFQYSGKSPNTLGQIWNLVRRFSDNRMILAHWGGGLPFFGLLKKEADEILKNIWFDTAAGPYLYKPEVYNAAAIAVGWNRILMGTDFPLLTPLRYRKDMAAAGVPASAVSAIMGGNAEAFLDGCGGCRAG